MNGIAVFARIKIAVISTRRRSGRKPVASILVRNLSDATKERLRRRAIRHNRSLEAEVRAILKRAAEEPVIATDERERFPD